MCVGMLECMYACISSGGVCMYVFVHGWVGWCMCVCVCVYACVPLCVCMFVCVSVTTNSCDTQRKTFSLNLATRTGMNMKRERERITIFLLKYLHMICVFVCGLKR